MTLRVLLLLAALLAMATYFALVKERQVLPDEQPMERPLEGVASESNSDVRQQDSSAHGQGGSTDIDAHEMESHVHENTDIDRQSVIVRTSVGIVETKKSISLPIVNVVGEENSEQTVASGTVLSGNRASPSNVAHDGPMATLQPGSQPLIDSGGPLDGRGQDPVSSGVGPDGTIAARTEPPGDVSSQMPGPTDGVYNNAQPSVSNFELPGDDVEDPDGDVLN